MTSQKKSISSWLWSQKFKGFLYIVCQFINYTLDIDDLNAINHGMDKTNDEKNQWFSYSFFSNQCELNFELAYDNESKDIIHYKITSGVSTISKIILLQEIECHFKNWELIDKL